MHAAGAAQDEKVIDTVDAQANRAHPSAAGNVVSDKAVLGEGDAAKLEDEYVHKVYDVIAPHFSHTRHNPWPKVSAFLNGLDDGSLVADVGCGNGKYMGVNKKLFMSGSDRSGRPHPPPVPLCVCWERLSFSGVDQVCAVQVARASEAVWGERPRSLRCGQYAFAVQEQLLRRGNIDSGEEIPRYYYARFLSLVEGLLHA